jgi:lipopolysaccharide/colanic/teichoic acid biosynthesis glycosyltransferase
VVDIENCGLRLDIALDNLPSVATSNLKRAFDVVSAAAGLIVLSPVLLVTAFLVRQKIGRPVLFRQTRPGLNGEPFEILKFRTMTEAVGDNGQLLPDEERMTRLGQTLRSTSLDELPELLNVIRGEMSLVGPRPLVMRYLDRYTPEQARRNLARPGITGLAQVKGRNALSWEDRFELDVQYVDNWNFLLDLKILVWTVGTVLRRDGISTEGHATAPEFMGSDDAKD